MVGCSYSAARPQLYANSCHKLPPRSSHPRHAPTNNLTPAGFFGTASASTWLCRAPATCRWWWATAVCCSCPRRSPGGAFWLHTPAWIEAGLQRATPSGRHTPNPVRSPVAACMHLLCVQRSGAIHSDPLCPYLCIGLQPTRRCSAYWSATVSRLQMNALMDLCWLVGGMVATHTPCLFKGCAAHEE